MAEIFDTVVIESGSRFPSLGSLIGSRVSVDIYNDINNSGYQSFFGDQFDHMRNEFFNRYVRPMDELNLDISRTVNALINPDRFRILNSVEDFRSIPPCMEMAICLYEPIRQGMVEGRIEGFGWIPETLPEEDVYGRLLSNFECLDVQEASDGEGYYEVHGTLMTDDPDLSDDELWAIRKTRQYILDKILATTDRDPTAIDLPRG